MRLYFVHSSHLNPHKQYSNQLRPMATKTNRLNKQFPVHIIPNHKTKGALRTK
uniref:Uncharacterized protein n=1 Tax=Arundo donax TaxID=35708 RepID=A0A0A8YHH5_ARUDO